jgi:hypothetical protein
MLQAAEPRSLSERSESKRTLRRDEWQPLAAAHSARADTLTAAWREAHAAGRAHPVEDFLFTYYGYSPSQLRRWHPGEGISLADAGDAPNAAWRWYGPGAEPGSLIADAAGFRAAKAPLIAAITRILRGTMSREPRYGCFGLHEWAMVYRADEIRHPVPLRLGRDGTDAVVEASALRCTHIDAFRFFTPDAVPRNARVASVEGVPTRESQPDLEQPGCLHAGMDLYKWAMKLGPLVPGDLLLDAFELARDIRRVDMDASPYDPSVWGGEPIRIETPDGRAEYARRQREFAERGAPIRAALAAIADDGR